MLLRRVKDYRGSPWWNCGAATTQMHQNLDRRPWEEKVESRFGCRERGVVTEQIRRKDVSESK